MLSISVITPSLNQCGYIEKTLRSVLSQDIPDLEYVVVDGGSTDKTLEILNRFTPELRWISEGDRGQADAVNKGIRATNGEIIGWLNSDDIYYPGALGKVAALFERYPHMDVMYGDAWYIGADDEIITPYATEAWNPERLKGTCYLCQPAVFFRRRVVDRFGFLDVRLGYCMDYEFWLRLSEGGARFLYVPEMLAGSRLHPSAKSLAVRMKAIQETNRMLLRKFGHVPDQWLLSYARIWLNRRGVRRAEGGRLDSPVGHCSGPSSRVRVLGTITMAPVLALGAILISLLASLWWNRGISRSMFPTLGSWIRGYSLSSQQKRISSRWDSSA